MATCACAASSCAPHRPPASDRPPPCRRASDQPPRPTPGQRCRRTASHTVAPIRPPAPNTPTRDHGASLRLGACRTPRTYAVRRQPTCGSPPTNTRSMTRLDIVGADAFDAGDQIFETRDLAFDQFRASEPPHAARRRFQRHGQRPDEMPLGRRDLGAGKPLVRPAGRARRRSRPASPARARARFPRRWRRSPRRRSSPRYENTEYASPRDSRISWNSRDDIPPPKTWLTIVSA